MKKNKIMTCIVTSMMALTLFNSMSVTADSFDNIGVSPNIPSSTTNIVPYSTDKPNNTLNLSSYGTYSFSGEADRQLLYTNYNFTGKSKFDIKVNNKGSKGITVKLCKNVFGSDSVISSAVVPVGGTTTWSVSVSSDSKYYLSFSAPSLFSGTIS